MERKMTDSLEFEIVEKCLQIFEHKPHKYLLKLNPLVFFPPCNCKTTSVKNFVPV